jgi:polar amino acid transport system substrate-binding protein
MRSAAMKLTGALLGAAALVAAGTARADEAPGGTLDRLRQQKIIRIAYREDAPPFSYKDSIGEGKWRGSW